MELTYQVRGPDGQEYGPATLEQLSQWLREGRVSAQTEIRRADMDYWVAAQNFTELQPALAAATPQSAARPGTLTSPTPAVLAASGAAQADPTALAQLKGGASWYFWIAGLSLINSIVALTGSDWGFVLGLGVTRIFDAVGQNFAAAGKIIVLGLDLMAAGVFVMFGVFAHKRHLWAFIVGMVLYALDGLIFLVVQDWLSVGFHAFALFCLFRGLAACRRLKSA